MAEEQNQEPLMTSDENASAQFQIQKLYVKDVSLEVPNAPEVFKEAGQADIKMSLAQRVEELGDNLHEVILTVTVTATAGEKTAYLVEVSQAGIFMLSGFNEQSAHAVMNIMCPNALFPYARQLISTLVADGGFPPLVLQPVNFEQMYAQRMQQMMEEQQQGAADQGEEEVVDAEFQTSH